MGDGIGLLVSIAVPWIAGTLWIRAALNRDSAGGVAISVGYGYLLGTDSRHTPVALARRHRGAMERGLGDRANGGYWPAVLSLDLQFRHPLTICA